MYQHDSPSTSARRLFEHVFGDAQGHLVAFSGRQARLERENARANELTRTRQRSFPYPLAVEEAISYLIRESRRGRDAYFSVHLFKEPNIRRSPNAVDALSCLWLDEDDGQFPGDGPEPTAVVYSSETRRHLYWRLAHMGSAEWVVEMNRRIAAWAGGDVGKAGLASVLRVPGTCNLKRHPKIDHVRLEITGVPPWEAEVLEQAVPPMPESEPPWDQRQPYNGPDVDLMEYLEHVEVLREAPDELGAKFAVVCPWVSEHSGGDRTGTFIGLRSGGGLWFYCYHEHCQGRTWPKFKQAVRRRAKKLKLIEKGEYFA